MSAICVQFASTLICGFSRPSPDHFRQTRQSFIGGLHGAQFVEENQAVQRGHARAIEFLRVERHLIARRCAETDDLRAFLHQSQNVAQHLPAH